MSAPGRAILFGVLIWLTAFVVAVAIFPLRESWRALFESIMPVVLALATVTFAALYIRRVPGVQRKELVLLGLLWFVINFVIDLPLVLTGPMGFTFTEYVADIGLTYLIIPTITIGMGLARMGQDSTCAE